MMMQVTPEYIILPDQQHDVDPAITQRLSYLSVLVVDKNVQSAQFTQAALTMLGVRQASIRRDAAEAIRLMHQQPIDIVICEWKMKGMDGLEFARYLRMSPESPNRTVPILIATYKDSPENILLARDAGVHDFIPKPISPSIIKRHLNDLIDNPRSFVISDSFVGPCRREERGTPPAGSEDRRILYPEPVISTLGNLGLDKGRPKLIMPDYSLQKRLENPLVRMAGLEVLLSKTEAPKLEETYLPLIMNDIISMRQLLHQLSALPAYGVSYVGRIAGIAQAVQSRATPLGYTLGVAVTTMLQDFCLKQYRRNDPQHVLIIGKHLETLTAIFSAKMSGTGGELGNELLGKLQLLVKKYT